MSTREKIFYAKDFDSVTSVTDANNNLIIGTSNPQQFSKYFDEPIVTFKTSFDGEAYNIKVCDERLLYSSLFAWRDLRLTSLFQGDHEIIYDESHGKLECAERENYLYTLKVAKLLLNKANYNMEELYEIINKMINYEEYKLFSKKSGKKKLSEDFFEEIYVPLVSKTNEVVGYPLDIQDFGYKKTIASPQKMLIKYYKKK